LPVLRPREIATAVLLNRVRSTQPSRHAPTPRADVRSGTFERSSLSPPGGGDQAMAVASELRLRVFLLCSPHAAWHTTTYPAVLEPVSDDELTAVLAAAIRDGKSGTMTRGAEVLLATICAEFLVERMAQAGLVVLRRAVS
jgi:hypothetical protein